MVDAARRPALAFEALDVDLVLGELGPEDLHRHDLAVRLSHRPEDHAHAALTQAFLQPIAAEAVALVGPGASRHEETSVTRRWSMVPRIGTEFAGYRIVALLGRGGMSIVYRAENPRLGTTVALKVLAPELAEDESFRERFVTESRLAAALNHPNIITIYDAGEADGALYIAMRYVPTDLKKVIEVDGTLPFGPPRQRSSDRWRARSTPRTPAS